MTIEAVIQALVPTAAITTLVGTRVAMLELPQVDPALAYPGLVWEPEDGVPVLPINASSGPQLKRARVQFTALSRSPQQVLDILAAVKAAVNYKNGVIGGVTVVSIVHALDGPWERDVDTRVFGRPVDYMVTFYD